MKLTLEEMEAQAELDHVKELEHAKQVRRVLADNGINARVRKMIVVNRWQRARILAELGIDIDLYE